MAALVLLVGQLLITAPPAPAEAPGLIAEPPAIDFGAVAQFTCEQRAIRIRNTATQAIRVLATSSDCQCLSSTIEARVLAPQSAADWRINLNVCSGYLGEVRRHVWLTTEPPDAQRVQVTVRYKVVPALYAEPGTIALGLIGAGVIEQAVELKTLAEEPIQLLAVSCDDGQVEAELLTDHVSREQPGRLRIRLQGPVPEGPFQPTLLVETACREVPQLRIPVLGESVSGLSSPSREAVFAAIPLGRCQRQTAVLNCKADVTVGSVRTSNDAVTVEAVERPPGQVRITLRSDANLRLGEFRGFLILEVNHGDSRTVKLPYRGQVVEPAAPASQPLPASSPPAVVRRGDQP